MNSIFAKAALARKVKFKNLEDLASQLSLSKNKNLREVVKKYALKNGMYELGDETGTNISVQIFDGAAIDFDKLPSEILGKRKKVND